jgi:hypothetical protein
VCLEGQADILARELREWKDINPTQVAERYHQLTGKGVSPTASAAVLCYECNFAENPLDLESISVSYRVLMSAYEIERAVEGLEGVESLYLMRLRDFLEPGERKEFVLGLLAASQGIE